jgi:hypothetical protein
MQVGGAYVIVISVIAAVLFSRRDVAN